MPPVVLFAHDDGGVAAAGLSPNGVLIGALAMFALVAVSLTRTWAEPRLREAGAAPEDRTSTGAGGVGLVVGRAVTVALLVLLIVVGLTGNPTSGANPVPIAVFSTFWFGGLLIAVLTGWTWTAIHPVAAVVAALGREQPPRPVPDEAPAPGDDREWWLPAVLLVAFAVLWLCWPGGLRPRPAAGYLLVWSTVLLGGGLRRGAAWVPRHDPFSLLFSAAAACSPVRWTGGRPRLGSPLRSLAARIGPGDRATAAVLAVTVGAAVFDGLRVTRGWADLVGSRSLASLTLLNSLAMIWVILVVAVGWAAAARASVALASPTGPASEGDGSAEAEGLGDDHAGAALALVLAPVLAFVAASDRLAQELDRFLVASQHVLALSSDPFARGRDLFGTADWRDQQLLPPATIAWLALLLILAGHLAALVVVHDRTVARFGPVRAARAEWPLVLWLALSLAAALRWMLG